MFVEATISYYCDFNCYRVQIFVYFGRAFSKMKTSNVLSRISVRLKQKFEFNYLVMGAFTNIWSTHYMVR